MTTMQKKSTDSSSKSPDVAEKFARALREKQIEHFSDQCPYAACLFPLLKALGWKNIDRELIEALPHFANELDLVDLRNILVNIGYESSPQTIALNQLQAELYPALFITSNEQVYILLAQENGGSGLNLYLC